MIRRVDAGTTRNFTDDELEAMRHKDTSAALNAARRNAGQYGPDVAVRGDDHTLDVALEHKQTHVCGGEVLGTSLDVLDLSTALKHDIPVASAVTESPFGIVAMGVGTFVAIQWALAELQSTTEGIRDAASRDTLRAGMLRALELPDGFVKEEVAKLGIVPTAQSPATKITNQIRGTPLAAALQLHCDQGITAAEDCLHLKMTRDQYFAASPAARERYASDAAFHAGFEGYVWAKEHAPADAAQMLADVGERDHRYSSAHLQLRL